MAKAAEWTCPICQDVINEVTYVIPCNHRFCVSCIMHWVKRNPSCPLCRRPTEAVKFSVQANIKYLPFGRTHPYGSQDASSQAGAARDRLAENSPPRPVASPPSSPQRMPSPAERGAVGTAAVGGLLPQVWAELFQRHQHLLDPVLPWLRHELAEIFGARWWLAIYAEAFILHCLCVRGPDQEIMVQILQDILEEYTALSLIHI